jgi:MFS family permease
VTSPALEAVPAAPATPAPALRENRDFLLVLGGQGISSFGDAISNTAIPILVLALTGSGFAMGIVGVLSYLPDLIVGLPAGAYADRWDRRKMMLLADLGRAGLTALVPISVWLGGPTLAIIIAVAFPINVMRVLWLAGYTAAVPGLVGREHVPRASAIFEAVFNVGWIVGPALAGLLAGWIGPGPTIALDAATFAVSALALVFVRTNLRPQARPEATHILADMREGIGFVARHGTLRAVIALWATMSIITAGISTAWIFYITIDRGLGTETVGIVLSAYALGSLGGALVAARIRWRSVGRVMLAACATTGISIALGVGMPVPVMVLAAFVCGFAVSNGLVAYVSLRTMLSPDALLGRVGATARTLSIGLMPIGSLITGVALDSAGGGTTIIVMGVLMVGAAVLFGLLPAVRGARLAGVRPAA